MPYAVTPRQASLALEAAGLLEQVETMIAGMTGEAGRLARIDWERARMIERDAPLINTMAAALSLTSEQVDALFVAAKDL